MEADRKVDSEMAIVLTSIATACKQISSLVARSGIQDLTGLAGASNVQARAATLRNTALALAGRADMQLPLWQIVL